MSIPSRDYQTSGLSIVRPVEDAMTALGRKWSFVQVFSTATEFSVLRAQVAGGVVGGTSFSFSINIFPTGCKRIYTVTPTAVPVDPLDGSGQT